jgi:hypothetical protein
MDAFATVEDELPLKPGSIMIHQCLPEAEDLCEYRLPAAGSGLREGLVADAEDLQGSV